MAGYRKLTATRNLKSLIPPESQASLTLCESGVGVVSVLRDRRDAKFPPKSCWGKPGFVEGVNVRGGTRLMVRVIECAARVSTPWCKGTTLGQYGGKAALPHASFAPHVPGPSTDRRLS